MQALLGALLVKLERDEEAEQTLRRVIEAAPTFAKPHEDLGFLLVRRVARTRPSPRSSARRISIRSSRTPGIHLGKALALLGRGTDADRRSSAASSSLPSGG